MKEYVCKLENGYSWTEIYFDKDRNDYYIKDYHCGGIDPGEEYLDWEGFVTKEEAFRLFVSHGCLGLLSRYYNADSDYELLDRVLDGMNKSCSIVLGYKREKNYVYYMFPDGKYAVYYHHTFFPDFKIVKEILNNSDCVTVSRYSYGMGRWDTTTVKSAEI